MQTANQEIIDQDIRDAILSSEERNVLVEASAGSGKTHTLVEKAFWYVHNNYLKHYQNMALITFTRYATSQIEDTVKGLISKENAEGTNHKKHIKEEYQRYITITTNFGYVSQEIIRPFLRDAFGKEYPNGHEWRQEFTRECKFETFEEGLTMLKSESVLGLYKDAKKNFIFELAIKILEKSSNARKYLKIKYPIIMIDEYQDVDPMMHEFFMYLKNQLHIRLFIVGDLKQAIYGFRGADSEIFIELRKEGFKSYDLIHNFRSHQSIVRYSREFIKEDYVNHHYDYGNSRVTMVRENQTSFVNYIIEHTGKVNKTYAYLLSRRNQLSSYLVEKLEKIGFVFMDDTPLNSHYANYEFLKWLLKYYHDERIDLFEVIYKLKGDFLTETVRTFEKILKKLKKGQTVKSLDLFEEVLNINLTENEVEKFKDSLNPNWSKYFQSEEPRRQILTIHGSKGLEFDHVFIEANSFFYYNDFEDKKHYVAITRAKESLTINLNSAYESILINKDLSHWL